MKCQKDKQNRINIIYINLIIHKNSYLYIININGYFELLYKKIISYLLFFKIVYNDATAALVIITKATPINTQAIVSYYPLPFIS